MNVSRRRVLQGIAALSAAAAAGKTSAFAAQSINSAPADSLHWPPPLGSPVTESLRPVIENSHDVRTHYEKIVEIAGWMAYEELPMPNLAVPYGLEKTPDIAMDFVMVGNTIDNGVYRLPDPCEISDRLRWHSYFGFRGHVRLPKTRYG